MVLVGLFQPVERFVLLSQTSIGCGDVNSREVSLQELGALEWRQELECFFSIAHHRVGEGVNRVFSSEQFARLCKFAHRFFIPFLCKMDQPEAEMSLAEVWIDLERFKGFFCG